MKTVTDIIEKWHINIVNQKVSRMIMKIRAELVGAHSCLENIDFKETPLSS